MPLGIAAKVYVNVGKTDLIGKVIENGEEGWYYFWWRGVHLLCGKEGMDAGFTRSNLHSSLLSAMTYAG